MKLHLFKPAALIFLLLCIPGSSQHARMENIKFRHLSIEHGLSQSSAFSIVQDTKGFIWIGTEAGLNRYDGYSFKVFEHDPENQGSLSNQFVLVIYKDRSGVLWIGTENGLNRFDAIHERFTRFLKNPDDPNSLSNNRVTAVCEDRYGFFWIGTEFGLNRFNKEKQQFTQYYTYPDNPYCISSNQIRAIFEDKSGVLWIGTYGGGLNQYDRKNDRFFCYKNVPGNPTSLSDNHVLSMYQDRDGMLWIGTEEGGLNTFDYDNGTFMRYRHDADDPHSISDNNVNCMYEDEYGTFWVGTNGGGLNIFDRLKREFVSFTSGSDEQGSISGNGIISICEDNNGILWFGTLGGGINMYSRETQKFVHYKSRVNDPNSLSYKNIRPIYEDSTGVLWIGTDGGGLNKLDRKTGVFKRYQYNPDKSNSISNNRVFSICEDHSGSFWIGTEGGGLNKFDREKEQFARYMHDPKNFNTLGDNRIRVIREDSSGFLWIGTNGGGLDKFNLRTETFVHYKNDPDNPHSLSNNRIYSMYIDRSNVLWIGTFGGGLNQFDREKQQFIHYKTDPDDSTSICENFILSIVEDSKGSFWVGTISGLNKYDRSKGVFTRYTTKHGLPDNFIYDILEDGRGFLWLSTNKGISRLNPETMEIKNFDVKDGLQSNEFNTGTGHLSRNGEMFFGGINGFNSFFPDSIIDNPFVPPVVITSLQIFNKPVNTGEIRNGRIILKNSMTVTKEITLSFKDNVFSFEFAALHYVAPERNQYAYIMTGLEKDWNYAGNRRFVTYSGIPPGKYIFRVKGSNNDGIWNEEGTSVSIIINPPFWKTWWFYFLCFIILTITAAAAYTSHINRLQKQKEEEERVKVITDVSQVLEHGRATIYRRNRKADAYEYMGNGIRDISGYTPEEITLSLWRSIVISIELIGEHSDLSLEEAFDRMQGGKLNSFVMDFNLRTKAGDIRWARDITTALRDESGNCYGYLGIILDITDRKLAELELSQKRRSIQLTLFEHTPDPIFIFDKKTHTFLDCNKAVLETYGYSKDEIRSMTPYNLHPPEDFRKVEKNIDVQNVDAPNEYRHITKEGRLMDVEIVSDETMYEGQPAWISMVRNITERKQAQVRLTQLSSELTMKNREMEEDLRLAHEVQLALLSQNYPKYYPRHAPPEQSTLHFFHRYIPTSTLAGDFFEILPITDDTAGVLIYDVMGHGVRTSLITAYVHGLIGELMPLSSNPGAFITRLNIGLSAITNQFYIGMFATAFYCVVDIKNSLLQCTNAGHPAPCILQRDTNAVTMIHNGEKRPDPPLGLFNDLEYTTFQIPIRYNDIILFYTDGIYEVEDKNQKIFGPDRLLETIKSQLHKPPEEMLDGILGEINQYAGTREFRDDVCMVAMHVKKALSGSP